MHQQSDGNQFGVAPQALFSNGEPYIERHVTVLSDRQRSRQLEQNLMARDMCREILEHQNTNKHYLVRLTPRDCIPIDEISRILNAKQYYGAPPENGEIIARCIDTVFRSIMLSTMIAPGESPRMMFIPPRELGRRDMQHLLSRDLKSYYTPPNSKTKLVYTPLVGMRQNVSVVNGKILLGVDTGMSYFNRDREIASQQPSGPGEFNFPVLARSDGVWSIAGERIGSADHPIMDPALRKRIEAALKSYRFHVRYQMYKDKDGNNMKEPQVQFFRNLKNKRPKSRETGELKEPIIWAANNAELYSFEFENNAVSVCQYYERRYACRLQYPHMPLIGTYKGYFPVEFLFQALQKTKKANSDDQVRDSLQFNDEMAGNNRIEHIKEVRSVALQLPGTASSPGHVLDAFNLSFSEHPLQLTANVLDPPTLASCGASGTMDVERGSWNLRKVKFESPATMNSFAVLDFTGGSSRSVVCSLFKKMKEHGMELPSNLVDMKDADMEKAIERVTARCSQVGFQNVATSLEQAVGKARSYFILGHPASTIGFRTMSRIVYNNTIGSTENCFAFAVDGGRVGLVLDAPSDKNGNMDVYDSRWPTHHLLLPNGEQVDGRLRLVFGSQLVDPINVKCSSVHGYEGFINGQWQSFDGPPGRAYVYVNERELVTCYDPTETSWIHLVDSEQVECPAVIIACLPQKDAGLYRLIKCITNAILGVQSQCLVKSVYKKTSVGGYLSNVALKLNAKLANSWSDARAWTSPLDGNLSWIGDVEAPTMILGLSMSHSSLEGSVVVGSVCLDNMNIRDGKSEGKRGGFMQMGHDVKITRKSDIIKKMVMKDLVLSLVFQYSRRPLPAPIKRVLLYRDGGTDTNFASIREEELEGIKLAFVEANALFLDCEACVQKSCVVHMPKITFIVAQSDHGIRIVPDPDGKPSAGGRDHNVPSGTCIDGTMDTTVVSSSKDQPSFLLIPQHGLKGTSRAVLYKVIANESELSLDDIQKLTFTMSFHYGTATKTVRHVPVVLYSKRLAEQVVGYMTYLQMEKVIYKPETKDAIKPDGTEQYCWDRVDVVADLQRQGLELKPMHRTGILPAFGPFDPRLATTVDRVTGDDDDDIDEEQQFVYFSLRNPYRPHLAA